MSVDTTSSQTQAPPRTGLEATIATSELLLFCRDLRGTTTDVLVAATGRSLALHSGLGGGEPAGGVGVVVAGAGGLLVPVVRNAGEAPLPAVRDEVERVVGDALAGRLSPDDMGAAAVVVHDPFPDAGAALPEALGSYVLGVDRSSYDSPELTLSLSVDGAAAGGEEAARFFAMLVRLLRHPYRRLV